MIMLALLIELLVRSESRMLEDGGYFEDGVFGYDFSEGYTSLESSAAKVRPYKESALRRWRRRRSELRRQRRMVREAAEERRMDEILDKLHREGRGGAHRGGTSVPRPRQRPLSESAERRRTSDSPRSSRDRSIRTRPKGSRVKTRPRSTAPAKPRRDELKPGQCLCDFCTGKCCRYFSLPIDTPRSWDDYDSIRWYLAHGQTLVYVVKEQWYLLVKTRCKYLDRRQSLRDLLQPAQDLPRIHDRRVRVRRGLVVHQDVRDARADLGVCRGHAAAAPEAARRAAGRDCRSSPSRIGRDGDVSQPRRLTKDQKHG